jgi:hypothetical protein
MRGVGADYMSPLPAPDFFFADYMQHFADYMRGPARFFPTPSIN